MPRVWTPAFHLGDTSLQVLGSPAARETCPHGQSFPLWDPTRHGRDKTAETRILDGLWSPQFEKGILTQILRPPRLGLLASPRAVATHLMAFVLTACHEGNDHTPSPPPRKCPVTSFKDWGLPSPSHLSDILTLFSGCSPSLNSPNSFSPLAPVPQPGAPTSCRHFARGLQMSLLYLRTLQHL